MERYREAKQPRFALPFASVPDNLPERLLSWDAGPGRYRILRPPTRSAMGEFIYSTIFRRSRRRQARRSNEWTWSRIASTCCARWGEPVVTLSTHIDTVPPFFSLARRRRIHLGARRLRYEGHHRVDDYGGFAEQLLAEGVRGGSRCYSWSARSAIARARSWPRNSRAGAAS